MDYALANPPGRVRRDQIIPAPGTTIFRVFAVSIRSSMHSGSHGKLASSESVLYVSLFLIACSSKYQMR